MTNIVFRILLREIQPIEFALLFLFLIGKNDSLIFRRGEARLDNKKMFTFK